MSYNIDSIDVVAAEGFGITVRRLDEIEGAVGNQPEISPFGGQNDSLPSDAMISFAAGRSFPWSGEWSGHSFDVLRDTVLPAFAGRADLVVCWEGGDSYTGLRLADGVVTEHEVVRTLGKQLITKGA